MEPSQIFVTATGALAIAWVVWFFFLGERTRTRAAAGTGSVQEIDIVVKGGYSPDTIVVERGRPVRLNFDREESASCSDTVVFGDFGIAKSLPAFKTTPVEFTPAKTGEFTFTCGMNMLRGRLIVEEPEGQK